MNDYWNDPPETPEPPMCDKCQEYMESADWISAKCPQCGTAWAPLPQQTEVEEGGEQMKHEPLPPADKCPHGNEFMECDACFHESDLAYDAARERRGK